MANEPRSLLERLAAGQPLQADEVELLERSLVAAANESRRKEEAALNRGSANEALAEQDVRRNLLKKLDQVRKLPGAVGVPTSTELAPYRIGSAVDLLADASAAEERLGRERRIGVNAPGLRSS